MYKKFYNLFKPSNQYSIAKAPGTIDPQFFPKKGFISDWKIPTFTIPKQSGILSDYTSSGIGGRLVSNKLKQVIDSNQNQDDIPIQWLPVNLCIEDFGEVLHYNHLHFPIPYEKYCSINSKFEPSGELLNPKWAYKEAKNQNIFNCGNGYERIITIISERVKKEAEDANCTGLSLRPASVIYD